MTRRPLTSCLLLALAATPAFAQESPASSDQPANDKQSDLSTIVVTGTRASKRTIAESSSPIDVLTPEALESTGTTELATALSRALPSLNFPRPAITDGTDAVRPAQLRGLAPDQVLVLVNGKRRHTTALINLNGSQGRGSSPVDLNAIPLSAIQRVEVLRDGASAQYGSDAISGVINIILKKGGDGGEVSLTAGQYSAGDGRQERLSGDLGFNLGDRGFVRLAAELRDQDNTDRARPYKLAPGTTVWPSTAPPPGKVVQRFGDPEIKQSAFSANAEFSPAESITFYAFANASRRNALSNGFYRTTLDPRNIPALYPNGFLPKIRNIAKDSAFTVGLHGTTANDWDLDFSYNYGTNLLSFAVEDSLNRSLGVISPSKFYAGSLEVTQHVLDLDVKKSFDVGLPNPLNAAIGVEWRGENFKEGPGDLFSWINGGVPLTAGGAAPSGSQVFPGFRPSDAGNFDRHSYSAYVDLETEFSERFSAGLAGRSERYSDFGNTTSGKLSARFAFNERTALRGTVSTGFRAPSLQQQFFRSTATNSIGGVPFEIRTFRVNDAAAIALGAEPLKPEKSVNYSLGLVMQPVNGMYVTIDAYRIGIKDRIMLSENLTSTAVRNYLNLNVDRALGGGRYFTNAIDTTTKGIDAILTYRWKLGDGRLDLTTGFNYNKTTVDRIAPNPLRLRAIDPTAVRIGRVEVGRLTVGSPRDKFQLGGEYALGAWTFGANATRYGRFSVLFGTNPADTSRDQTFAPQWTLDVSGSYTRGRWTMKLGADNLFNSYPDEVIYANATNGQIPYSSASPNGFNGAFVYGRIACKW